MLLQVEKQVTVVVKQLWVKLVHERRRLADTARLDALADPDPVVHRVQVRLLVGGQPDASLVTKLLCSVFEALSDEVIHDQLVHALSLNVVFAFRILPVVRRRELQRLKVLGEK